MAASLCFMIVGRDGDGKTSVCKTILSKQNHDQPDSVIKIHATQNMNIGSTMFEGRKVTAIDGKCIGDTEPDLKCSLPSLVSAINKAIPSDGITAFVFVMKYGTRYTKQEKDAVERIKLLFGEDVFRKWGVLVFTHGDHFERDRKGEDVSFDDWAREQKGDIASLFKECRHRYVLFNNGLQHKQSMVRALMAQANTILDGPYTREMFANNGGRLGTIEKSLDEKLVTFIKEHKVKFFLILGGLALLTLIHNDDLDSKEVISEISSETLEITQTRIVGMIIM